MREMATKKSYTNGEATDDNEHLANDKSEEEEDPLATPTDEPSGGAPENGAATTGEDANQSDAEQEADAASDADAGGEDKESDGDAEEEDDAKKDSVPAKAKGKRGRPKADKPKAAAKTKAAPKTKAAKKEKKKVKLNVPDESEDDEEEEAEYEVEDIVDHKFVKGKVHYKIRWKGYGPSDDTWEPKSTLSCPEIVANYEEENDITKASKGGASGGGAKGKAKGKPAPAAKGKKRGRPSNAGPAKKKAKKEESSSDEEEGDPEKEYEVDRILEVRNKKGGREFLVHWKGWSSRYDSWEPEDNLSCEDLIKKFDVKLDKAKSATQKQLRIAPKTTKRFVLSSKEKGRRLSKRGDNKQRVTYYDAE